MSAGHAACATRHRHSRCATADRCRAVRAHSAAAQAVLAWARAGSAAQPRMRDAATRAAEPPVGPPLRVRAVRWQPPSASRQDRSQRRILRVGRPAPAARRNHRAATAWTSEYRAPTAERSSAIGRADLAPVGLGSSAQRRTCTTKPTHTRAGSAASCESAKPPHTASAGDITRACVRRQLSPRSAEDQARWRALRWASCVSARLATGIRLRRSRQASRGARRAACPSGS